MKRSVLIFLHIPKTAGSSLGHAIHRQYEHSSIFFINGNNPEHSIEKFVSLPDDQRSRFLCISGHIPFGLHEYIPRNVVYSTILRDPVDRILSLYHHVLRETSHYMYETVISKKMGLLDFVGSGLSRELCNDQTRMISGIGEWNQKTDRTMVDETAFQKAMKNIEIFFPVVGLTEMFDESLLLMQDVYSWNNVFYTNRRVFDDGSEKKPVDAFVLKVIRERNQYDLMLYDYARDRLQKQIDEKGTLFEWRVRQFQIMNNMYNRVRIYRHTPFFSALWKIATTMAIRQPQDD